MASKKKATKTDSPAIPGAENRMAEVDETRGAEGSGEQGAGGGEQEEQAPESPSKPNPSSASSAPSAVKSAPASVAKVEYRGQRCFRCRVPIVEEGLAYSPQQTIRLTAQRARQMGPSLLALIDGEDYADEPRAKARDKPS